jgi:adenosylhomocysteine nucleosidase
MSESKIAEQIERAFDYRGFVTVWRRDGSKLVGYIYDRGPDHVELYDDRGTSRLRIATADIAEVALTGDDAAAKAHTMWERRHGKLEPGDTSAWGGWEDRPTLLLVALPSELRVVARVIGGTPHGNTAVGKLGECRAVAIALGPGGGGAALAVAAQRPRLVVSCGFAGALDPFLAAGDIVIASSVRDEHGDSIPAAHNDLELVRRALDGSHRVAEGEILCATQVAVTRDEKRALARPGRLAIDLESFPAARAAHDAKIPWLAIRVVVDPLDSDLPPFARDPHASYVLPALRHAITSTRAMLDLARLGVRARTANRSLERALGGLVSVVTNLRPPEVER